MSRGGRSINIGVNMLLRLVEEQPKEPADGAQGALRRKPCGGGGQHRDGNPLHTVSFFAFLDMYYKKNKIIPATDGVGGGRQCLGLSVGWPAGVRLVGGPCPSQRSSLCHFLPKMQPSEDTAGSGSLGGPAGLAAQQPGGSVGRQP